MKKVYINDSDFSEVISELVADLIHERFLEDDIYVYDEEGNSEYTEEVQEYHNKKFDQIEAMFNQKWDVHSSSMLEIEQDDDGEPESPSSDLKKVIQFELGEIARLANELDVNDEDQFSYLRGMEEAYENILEKLM